VSHVHDFVRQRERAVLPLLPPLPPLSLVLYRRRSRGMTMVVVGRQQGRHHHRRRAAGRAIVMNPREGRAEGRNSPPYYAIEFHRIQ